MREKKQRYDNIDLLKAISILFVIIIHGCCTTIDFWNMPSWSNYVHYGFRTILSVSVPIFFLCNGFLLFGRELNIKKHIIKIGHFVLVTYAWAVITVVFIGVLTGETLPIGEIWQIIREWRAGWVNHLWFMGALVCIYIVFPVIKGCADSNRGFLLYFTGVTAIFTIGEKSLEMLLSMVRGRVIAFSRPFDMFNPFETMYSWAYVYFALGGILCLYKDKILICFENNCKRWNIYCVGLLVISYSILGGYGMFVSTLISGNWDHVWNGYDTIFIMAASLAMFGLSLNYKADKNCWFAQMIRLIGQNTLGIYFVHMMFIHVLDDYVRYLAIFNNIFMQMVYSLGVLILSLVVVLLIRKIPLVSWMVK